MLAATACGIQVVFGPVLPATIAAPQDAVFAEHELPGQMQILFPTFLIGGVQYITPLIYTGYILLKLSIHVHPIYNNPVLNPMGRKTVSKIFGAEPLCEGSFLSVLSNIRNVFKQLLFIMVRPVIAYL